PIAGNYLCVRADGADFEVVSVGETLDLSGLRKALPKKVREAMTHVYTRLNVARAIRCAEHADLVARHRPARTPTPTACARPPLAAAWREADVGRAKPYVRPHAGVRFWTGLDGQSATGRAGLERDHVTNARRITFRVCDPAS